MSDKAIIVVSFGTSYKCSRDTDILFIEDSISKAFPKCATMRAFTSKMVINHIKKDEGIIIDDIEAALDRALKNNIKHLLVQPTHLLAGKEYEKIKNAVDKYSHSFTSLILGSPLLGKGDNVALQKELLIAVAKAVTEDILLKAGYKDMESAKYDKTAIVLMGHGTEHTANHIYTDFQNTMDMLGYDNVFIGTVEEIPDEMAPEPIMEKIKAKGYEKVILRPLMVVAGDHAHNDMAGDEDSWLSLFTDSGYFDKVDAQIAGLGQIAKIQDMYIDHAVYALENAKHG